MRGILSVSLLLFLVGSLAVPSVFPNTTPSDSKFHGTLPDRMAAADALTPLRTIVQFDDFSHVDPALIEALGGRVLYRVQATPALFVYAPKDVLQAISTLDHVTLIEYDEPLEFDLATAVLASRAFDLWGVEKPNVTTSDGKKVDGSGIGVAIVDTGVNSLHNDIAIGQRVARNLQAVGIPVEPNGNQDPFVNVGPVLFVDTVDSDGGGHGSHVASIVGGSGAVSGGKYRGAAPGAALYGFGSLDPIGFWYAVAAWDWIYQHGADQSPPIRIITNSWGYATGKPCDLQITLTKVERKLVLEKNIAMFFSAGNRGRDANGSQDTTRTQFKCPWEGIIGVSSMDDEDAGNRDGPPSAFTSKGKLTDSTTWPDLSAPGSNITAVNGKLDRFAQECLVGQATGGSPAGCYRSMSGTSMATPFAAGVGALVLQARPDLKPADLEFILEYTAYRYGPNQGKAAYQDDAANHDYRHDGSHYVRGHGLVDAEAAVRFALNYTASEYPVVYGENEVPKPWINPNLQPPPCDACQTVIDEATPGVSLGFVLLATLVGVAVWRRRGL